MSIHAKESTGKVQSTSDTGREEVTLGLALRTCVCLERLDWKDVPSKGGSRRRSRQRTSPPSIQERVGEWFSAARLQSVFVSRNGF